MQIPKNEYTGLYARATIPLGRRERLEAIVSQIKKNQAKYKLVETQSHIPWWCVAVIHSLEASLNFSCHLHNGDPLTDRTVHFPPGRPLAMPASGKLPYTWTESALDALSTSWKPGSWSFSGCFEFLERYNGIGYRVHGINTPYLWSFTNQYSKGYYRSDGKFDPEKVSQDAGAAAILKLMEEQRLVQALF